MLHIFAAVHQLQDWIIRNTGANHSHSQRSERCWRSEISSVLAIYSNPLWISPKIRSYWALLRTFPINWHATVISFDCRPDENNTSSLFIGSTFIAKDNKSPFAEEWQRNSALINWNSRQLHSAKTILFLIFIRWTQRIKIPGYEDFSGNARTTILCIRSDTFLLTRPIIPQHPRIQNLEHRIYDFQTLLLDLKLPVPSTPPGRFDRLWPQMEKRTNWILLWDTYFTITKDSNTNWFPRHSQGAQIPPYHLVTVYTTFESDYFRSKDSV